MSTGNRASNKKLEKVILVVSGTKVITGNRDIDFVNVAPFEVNDEKTVSDENVVNVQH